MTAKCLLLPYFPSIFMNLGRTAAMYLPSSRRIHVLLAVITCLILGFILHFTYQLGASVTVPRPETASKGALPHTDHRVQARVDRLRGICVEDDPFEREYGRTNLRMSRGYEGDSYCLDYSSTRSRAVPRLSSPSPTAVAEDSPRGTYHYRSYWG